MRTGVLWADVEKKEVRTGALPAHAPLLRTEAKRLLLGIVLFGAQLIRFHFRRASRVLFAQRVTRPALGHQDSFQAWVAVERDPEHVPHFAFVPISRGPDVSDRRQRERAFG